jgi:hypothetical protein
MMRSSKSSLHKYFLRRQFFLPWYLQNNMLTIHTKPTIHVLK